MYFRGQRFDYGDAAKIKDMIARRFARKFPMRNGIDRRDMDKKIRSVFVDFLGLLMDDLIENNNVFVSPNSLRFIIKIAEKGPGETKRLMVAKHRYQNVDLIASDGKFYQFYMCFEWPTKQYRPIRISKRRYDRIVELVNKGKRYHRTPLS